MASILDLVNVKDIRQAIEHFKKKLARSQNPEERRILVESIKSLEMYLRDLLALQRKEQNDNTITPINKRHDTNRRS